MNLDKMTLSSPNYPKEYNADGVGCEWLISAPEGSIIALEFNYFDVSDFLDFVKKFCNKLQHLFFHILVTIRFWDLLCLAL